LFFSRVAMRQGSAVTYPSAEFTLSAAEVLRMYLHGDHPSTRFARSGQALGSTSVASSASGALVSRQTYYAFGAPRTTEASALPTDYTFTGRARAKSLDKPVLSFRGAHFATRNPGFGAE
jgi:hypothetical protein